jgi:uncharacterized SAM-binding protein YcdF (DUF218 family)
VSGATLLVELIKTALLPPTSLLLLFALGLFVGRRRRRLGRGLCVAAFGLLYALSTGVGSWLLAHRLEQLEPALARGAPSDAQAIVVLAAGRIRRSPEYDGRPVPDFLALERMAYGAHLARARALPLLVSGGMAAPDAGESLAAGMRRTYLDAFGLPVAWVEERSRTTAENARYSAILLRQAGIDRVILVTDAMHMRRARQSFERAGIRVTPGPTFFHEPGRLDPWRLMPTIENLRRSHYALYEWLGLAWYTWREL